MLSCFQNESKKLSELLTSSDFITVKKKTKKQWQCWKSLPSSLCSLQMSISNWASSGDTEHSGVSGDTFRVSSSAHLELTDTFTCVLLREVGIVAGCLLRPRGLPGGVGFERPGDPRDVRQFGRRAGQRRSPTLQQELPVVDNPGTCRTDLPIKAVKTLMQHFEGRLQWNPTLTWPTCWFFRVWTEIMSCKYVKITDRSNLSNDLIFFVIGVTDVDTLSGPLLVYLSVPAWRQNTVSVLMDMWALRQLSHNSTSPYVTFLIRWAKELSWWEPVVSEPVFTELNFFCFCRHKSAKKCIFIRKIDWMYHTKARFDLFCLFSISTVTFWSPRLVNM